jgi:DNA-binding cell septation regulator SpoVG
MNKEVILYQIYPNNKEGKTVAYLVVNIFGIVVNGIRVMPGTLGQFFVAYPSFKTSNGNYKETIHIEDSMLDREVKEEILRQYTAKINMGRINPFIPEFADNESETDKK